MNVSKLALGSSDSSVVLSQPSAQPANGTPTPFSYGIPAGADVETPLADYWRILVKRKWIVLACLVIVSTLAAVTTFRMVPQYESVARIAIYPENAEYMGFKDMASTSTPDWDYTVELDTQIGVLQSDTLAAQVIRKLHLERNPYFAPAKQAAEPAAPLLPDSAIDPRVLASFHSHLSVAKVAHTRIVEIRYLSPDPTLSAEIVNTLASAYMEYNFKTKYDATSQTSEWLAKQLADVRMKVETSQEALVRYQKENGILGIDEKQNIVTAKLDELNRDLTQAETDRMQKQARHQQLLSNGGQVLSAEMRDPVLDNLRQRRAELANRRAELSVSFDSNYPKLREINDQLHSLDAAITTQTGNILKSVEVDYQTALKREAMLRAALEQQKKIQNQLNESAVQYNLLKRDADTSRQLYEGLMQKMKEAGISAGLKSGNIRIVDVGRTPKAPAKPNRPLNLALGLWGGLFSGIVLSFVLEKLDNTIRDPDEVQMIIGLPLLGNIPRHLSREKKASGILPQPGTSEVAMVTVRQPRSVLSEAYRALRTSILLSSTGRSPQAILFTSGLPKEGKTTTSINSAIVLAQKGGRVLLIDADLRRPSIHHKLHVDNEIGLSSLLSGAASAEQCIRPTDVPNLFVITAGAHAPNPAELLGSQLMADCIAEWRTRFDHIVIDTPPVLTVTDAALLSVLVDGVVLVIRSGETTKGSLRHCRELLNHVGARIIGFVVNALDESSHAYYYYSYGYKYYHTGHEHAEKG